MSLSNTITYPGAATGRRSWIRGGLMVAAGVVLGIAIGLAIPTGGSAADSAQTVATSHTGLSHEQFVRLNTTDLVSPAAAASVVAVEPPATVDPFIYQNVTALDELAAAMGRSAPAVDPFIYQNVTALDELAAAMAGGTNGLGEETQESAPGGPR